MQHTLQQLRELKLAGMAHALEQQSHQPNTYDDIGFDQRMQLLVAEEMAYRDNRRLQRLLKGAQFRTLATLEEINYSHPRGLQKTLIASLQTMQWITHYRNILISGPTGCGKTYLACALGHSACHHGYTVRYFRASRLWESLTMAHGDGSYLKLIGQIAKAQLLIIDDWGLETLSQSQRNDFLEIMEDRHGHKSTLITSQLPIAQWYAHLNDPTLADAILDRLLHNAHKLVLKGESMRKQAASSDIA